MRRYQTWTEIRTLGAFAALALTAAGIWFRYPGPAAYLALLILAWAWPPLDRYEPDTPGSRWSERMTALSRELANPYGAKIGAGDPGENSEREPTWWPPTRLSTWWALPTTALTAYLAFTHPTNTNLPPLDIAAAYLIWQAGTATARRTAHPSDAAPAALANRDTFRAIRDNGSPNWLTRSAYRLAAVTGTATLAVVAAAATYITRRWPDLPHPPLPAIVAVVAAAGLLAAAAVITRRYIHQTLTDYRYRLEQAAWWQQMWMQLGVKAMPAIYAGEYDAPPADNGEPTHRVIHFQAMPGASVATYEDLEAKLAVATGSDLTHVGAIPQADPTGQPIPGTRRDNAFTVTYNLAPLPPRPLLDPDLDGWTTKYVIRAAFNHAFTAHKLGRPELANLALLTVPGAPQRMIETTWALPPQLTYDQLAKKAAALQDTLGVPWLRVGRRHTPDGAAAEHVSIVYGPPPHTLDFGPGPIGKSRREFVRTLEWEAAFRNVGLTSPDGTTPRFESDYESDQGLLVTRFHPAPNLDQDTILKTGPSLIPTIGRPYVLIEADASAAHKAADGTLKASTPLPAGGFQIITGDSDPLDRLFHWNDYAHEIMRPPGDQPHMAFYVGVGSDGGLVEYDFTSESPHLICAGASGRGKHLSLHTIVYLSDLTRTTVGELQVGDRILDDRGRPCTVTKVFAVEMPKRAYRLVFDDGTEILAGGEHQWVSHTAAYRQWLSKRAALESTEVWRSGREARLAEAARLRELAAASARVVWPGGSREPGCVFDETGEVWAGGGPAAEDLLLSADEVRAAAGEGLDPYLVGAWLSTLAGGVQVSSREPLVAERLAVRGHRVVEVSGNGRRRRWGVAGQAALFDAAGVSGAPGSLSVPEVVWSDPVRAGLLVQGVVDAVGERLAGGRVGLVLVARAAELVAKALGSLGVAVEVSLGGSGPRSRDRLVFDWSPVAVAERPLVCGFALGLWLSTRGTSGGSRSAAVGVRSAADVARLWRDGQPVSVHVGERWSRRVVLLDAKERLAALGVGPGDRRRVPAGYLSGSERVRRDVLDGLLVGAAAGGDGWSVVAADSSGFAGDVADLAGSLGVDAEVVSDGGVLSVRVGELAAPLPGPALFDSDGRALASVGDLAAETGASSWVLRRLVDDGSVGTVTAMRPMLQRYEDRFVTKPGPVLMVRREEALSAVAAALVEEDGRTGGRWPQPRLVDTDEIYATLRTTGAREAANHAFPVVGPVEPEGWEPVDWQVRPYELGAWLGDGSTASGQICGMDHEVFDRIIDEGRPPAVGDRLWKYHLPPRDDYHPDFRVVRFDEFTQDLKAVGVLGRKHIPDLYLRAPVADRLALMQGLMDTDGHVEAEGRCEFVTVVPELADGFGRLLSSLGIKYCRFVKKPTDLTRRPAYRFQFTTGLAVVSLPRKAARLPVGLRGTQGYRYVVDCVPVPAVPMRCLSVDSPSSQFLVGEEMVPTHNSNEIHGMLLQLLCRNTPEQLEVWMAEPKNELQRYQCVPHLKRFIDMRSVGPDESIYDSLAEMLRDLVGEMERRYALMDELPGRPQKLADMLTNPALPEPIPYIVCLVEECADYFAPPSLKDHRPAWEQVVFYGELLARKARASGIFMAFATQRPTKQSIPANIKGQSRRIGFGTTTLADSMVVIDQPGLEKLTAPGRGMVTSDKQGYRHFRAMYMPPEVTEDIAGQLPHVRCLDPRERDFSRGAAAGLLGAAPPIPDGIWGDGPPAGDGGGRVEVRAGDPFETPYGPSIPPAGHDGDAGHAGDDEWGDWDLDEDAAAGYDADLSPGDGSVVAAGDDPAAAAAVGPADDGWGDRDLDEGGHGATAAVADELDADPSGADPAGGTVPDGGAPVGDTSQAAGEWAPSSTEADTEMPVSWARPPSGPSVPVADIGLRVPASTQPVAVDAGTRTPDMEAPEATGTEPAAAAPPVRPATADAEPAHGRKLPAWAAPPAAADDEPGP